MKPRRQNTAETTHNPERMREVEIVNNGVEAVLGLRNPGSPERKKECEDIKVNDAEKGLYLVGDGVSTAAGAMASRELGRVVSKRLGAELDKGIENIAGKDIDNERKNELIKAHVEAKIMTALQEANASIYAMGQKRDALEGAATTASLMKHVEFPDGSQKVALSNSGDSRVYRMREGVLELLTRDDNMTQDAVDSGMITSEEADLIDQANGIDDLPDKLRIFYQYRNTITSSVGMGDRMKEPTVDWHEALPGDQFLITSDGISDMLYDSELEMTLSKDADDVAKERVLQMLADTVAQRGKSFRKRAKGDDISAIVKTIGERGPSREYLKPKQETAETSEKAERHEEKKIFQWKRRLDHQERALTELRLRITQERDPGKKLDMQLDLRDRELETARLEYWIARAQAENILEHDLPPRFVQNQEVAMKFRAEDGSIQVSPDRWVVSGFDKDTNKYQVRRTDGHTMEVGRIYLETSQAGDLARKGDKLTVKRGSGELQDGFEFVGFAERQGKRRGFMQKEITVDGEQKIASKHFAPEKIDNMIREKLRQGHAFQLQMSAGDKRLKLARRNKQELLERKTQLDARAARQKAQDLGR